MYRSKGSERWPGPCPAPCPRRDSGLRRAVVVGALDKQDGSVDLEADLFDPFEGAQQLAEGEVEGVIVGSLSAQAVPFLEVVPAVARYAMQRNDMHENRFEL